MASATDGEGSGVQRGKLENTRPVGETAAPLSMARGDAATRISSILLPPCFPATMRATILPGLRLRGPAPGDRAQE